MATVKPTDSSVRMMADSAFCAMMVPSNTWGGVWQTSQLPQLLSLVSLK